MVDTRFGHALQGSDHAKWYGVVVGDKDARRERVWCGEGGYS